MDEEKRQVKCDICKDKEWVKVPKNKGIKHHVKQNHRDEPEEVAKHYEQEVVAVVQEDSKKSVDNTTTECRLCGDDIKDEIDERLVGILDPADGDADTIEDGVIEHLITSHPNELDRIGNHYNRGVSNRVHEFVQSSRTLGKNDTQSSSDSNNKNTQTQPSVSEISTEINDSTTTSSEETEPSMNNVDPEVESAEVEPASNDVIGNNAAKWFVWGVGGAGNGILDSVLLRRETLEDISSPVSGIWGPGGMRGYHMINSNDAEVEGTFFIESDRDWDGATVIDQCIIGTGGMGEDPVEANEKAKEVVDEENWLKTISIKPNVVKSAQATLFLQSLVKGTGTGMTSVVAQYLRENEDWAGKKKPMVSAAVVPNEAKEDSDKTIYGLAGLAKPLDSIIMFSNDRLAGAPDELAAEIDFSFGPSRQKFGHKAENQTLIRFLEGLTMTSNMGVDISDDGYDVKDTFQPAVGFYPEDLEYTPAVICAPVLASFTGGSVTEETVDTLVFNALKSGRLVEFDPATAWGGSFLFAGPEKKMDVVSNLISDSQIDEMIRTHSGIMDTDGPDQFLRLRANQAILESADNLYLFGVMYNPKLPHLSRMYERSKTMKEFPGKNPSKLKKRWNHVDLIFDHLGIESLMNT